MESNTNVPLRRLNRKCSLLNWKRDKTFNQKLRKYIGFFFKLKEVFFAEILTRKLKLSPTADTDRRSTRNSDWRLWTVTTISGFGRGIQRSTEIRAIIPRSRSDVSGNVTNTSGVFGGSFKWKGYDLYLMYHLKYSFPILVWI